MTPPEVQEARVVEEVARAMYGAAGYGAPSWRPMWDDLDEVREQTWLSLAAAAVTAYRAAQDGGAEEAVRLLRDEGYTVTPPADPGVLAALAPQADVDYCPQSGLDSSTCWCCTTR